MLLACLMSDKDGTNAVKIQIKGNTSDGAISYVNQGNGIGSIGIDNNGYIYNKCNI